MIKVAFPITMADLAGRLIDLMSDAAQWSAIAIQAQEDLRAQQAAAHLLGQNAGVWSAGLQRSVAPQFDEQVDVATAALPQSMYAGGTLPGWREAAALAHSAVMAADAAAARAVDWAEAAEPEFEEAADEARELAAEFAGVSEQAATWAGNVRAAQHSKSARAAEECVASVQTWLTEQVGVVSKIYETIEKRKGLLKYGTGPSNLEGYQLYSSHPTVAERLSGCVLLCDAFERDLRTLVDDFGSGA